MTDLADQSRLIASILESAASFPDSHKCFKITCCKNNEQNDFEWMVPAGWGETAIIERFNEQFPQAQLISIEPCK